MIRNIFNGFCMALADSVPGVSGGTIAFILGFYDAFIESLDNLFYGNKEKKKTALKFLFKIGIGWILGMVIAIFVLTEMFEAHIYEISSLFLGFVMFSIPLIIREEWDTLKENYLNILFSLLGIFIVVLITYFNPAKGNVNSIDISSINFGMFAYIFLAGMLAVSAMVLPGISGSTILLILGVYVPVITSAKELLKFNFNTLPIIIAFGLGVVCGIFVTIKLIKLALNKHRSATIYTVLGLMVGSLYAICMGPTTLAIPVSALSLNNFNIITFILGMAIIIWLEYLKIHFDYTKSK